ncbi:hypothetical protein GCM10011328_09730 [Hafnia psychrotolerans]|uniref:Transposase n=1 Tax=Hafnia psychrotolerans TaxID=1477018 RepID=A0ABQ1G5D6_9GAMM|nr:hypothetical protein GCM10011328_09730 [Hafnia psychrotolerans]
MEKICNAENSAITQITPKRIPRGRDLNIERKTVLKKRNALRRENVNFMIILRNFRCAQNFTRGE